MPKAKTIKKKSARKEKKSPEPYSNLTLYQKKMRQEIQKLHHATETFVKIAVNKSVRSNTIHDIEKHILDIGRNIDELEDILHDISKRK